MNLNPGPCKAHILFFLAHILIFSLGISKFIRFFSIKKKKIGEIPTLKNIYRLKFFVCWKTD